MGGSDPSDAIHQNRTCVCVANVERFLFLSICGSNDRVEFDSFPVASFLRALLHALPRILSLSVVRSLACTSSYDSWVGRYVCLRPWPRSRPPRCRVTCHVGHPIPSPEDPLKNTASTTKISMEGGRFRDRSVSIGGRVGQISCRPRDRGFDPFDRKISIDRRRSRSDPFLIRSPLSPPTRAGREASLPLRRSPSFPSFVGFTPHDLSRLGRGRPRIGASYPNRWPSAWRVSKATIATHVWCGISPTRRLLKRKVERAGGRRTVEERAAERTCARRNRSASDSCPDT